MYPYPGWSYWFIAFSIAVWALVLALIAIALFWDGPHLRLPALRIASKATAETEKPCMGLMVHRLRVGRAPITSESSTTVCWVGGRQVVLLAVPSFPYCKSIALVGRTYTNVYLV